MVGRGEHSVDSRLIAEVHLEADIRRVLGMHSRCARLCCRDDIECGRKSVVGHYDQVGCVGRQPRRIGDHARHSLADTPNLIYRKEGSQGPEPGPTEPDVFRHEQRRKSAQTVCDHVATDQHRTDTWGRTRRASVDRHDPSVRMR